ncbi:MAG TPA: MoaD/ThiS family protein [Opitutaceae bacterium]|nr:MoaD/ThiS family protein [Opitutaceae bacterium]
MIGPRHQPSRKSGSSARREAVGVVPRKNSRKHVHVRYFAVLREQARCAEETIATETRTPAALYEELRARHGFSVQAQRLKVAVNDEIAAWDAALATGDRVAFIPPFAGG